MKIKLLQYSPCKADDGRVVSAYHCYQIEEETLGDFLDNINTYLSKLPFQVKRIMFHFIIIRDGYENIYYLYSYDDLKDGALCDPEGWRWSVKILTSNIYRISVFEDVGDKKAEIDVDVDISHMAN